MAGVIARRLMKGFREIEQSEKVNARFRREFLRSVDKIILTRYNGDRRNNMYNGTRARGYIQLFYFVTGRSFIRYKACSRRRAEIHGRLRLYGNACKSRSSLDRDTRYILNTCKHALLPGRV